MTLAQARALCAHVEHIEHEPHRDQTALEAVARWMMRFSPCVALRTTDDGGTGNLACESSQGSKKTKPHQLRVSKFVESTAVPTNSPPIEIGHTPAIWLDLTGTERLFGPPKKIAQQIEAAMQRWRINAKLAISHSPGAAWAMTFTPPPCTQGGGKGGGPNGRVAQSATPPSTLPPSQSTSRLRSGQAGRGSYDPLPVPSLRLPADIIAALHHLGIFTIGQLQKLPRDQLPSRFGSIILTRLDQLEGVIEEPLVPIEPVWPIIAHRRWEDPVESLEWIWPIAQELIAQIAEKLLRRGHGAREISAKLTLALGEPIERIIRFSRPTRQAKKIMELFKQAVESEGASRELSAAKRRADHGHTPRTTVFRRFAANDSSSLSPTSDLTPFDYNGYNAIRIEVLRSQRIITEQISLGESDSFQGEIELDDLVERVRVRLGERAIAQARPIESHVPERAFEVTLDELQIANLSSPILNSIGNWQSAIDNPYVSTRPLHLHAPIELKVIVSPSHDRDGRPVSLTDPDGNVHRIVHAVGPERIAGEWWIGHHKSRDYFDIELPDARRWWIFRVNETGRWFWQGEF